MFCGAIAASLCMRGDFSGVELVRLAPVMIVLWIISVKILLTNLATVIAIYGLITSEDERDVRSWLGFPSIVWCLYGIWVMNK